MNVGIEGLGLIWRLLFLRIDILFGNLLLLQD